MKTKIFITVLLCISNISFAQSSTITIDNDLLINGDLTVGTSIEASYDGPNGYEPPSTTGGNIVLLGSLISSAPLYTYDYPLKQNIMFNSIQVNGNYNIMFDASKNTGNNNFIIGCNTSNITGSIAINSDEYRKSFNSAHASMVLLSRSYQNQENIIRSIILSSSAPNTASNSIVINSSPNDTSNSIAVSSSATSASNSIMINNTCAYAINSLMIGSSGYDVSNSIAIGGFLDSCDNTFNMASGSRYSSNSFFLGKNLSDDWYNYSSSSGGYNFLMGYGLSLSDISGGLIRRSHCTLFGESNVSYYSHATLIGRNLKGKAYGTVIFGQYNDASYEDSLREGGNSFANVNHWIPAEPLLVLGNGTSDTSRSNAVVVLKNGNTTINGKLTANEISVKIPKGIPMGAFGVQE